MELGFEGPQARHITASYPPERYSSSLMHTSSWKPAAADR